MPHPQPQRCITGKLRAQPSKDLIYLSFWSPPSPSTVLQPAKGVHHVRNRNLQPAPAMPDLAAVKTRQQAAWSSGDYAVVGTTLQIVGEDLCEALDLRAGSRCSTSPPATATPRLRPRAAGAT